MAKLILLRHGESVWNKKNVFTGWVDVPLSKKGITEAIEAGKILENINYKSHNNNRYHICMVRQPDQH